MIGKGIEDAMTAILIAACIVSAVVGWGVIEGLIWIFSHISFSFIA